MFLKTFLAKKMDLLVFDNHIIVYCYLLLLKDLYIVIASGRDRVL